MKAHLLIPALVLALVLAGCNRYRADQATKRGVQAYDIAKEARSQGDLERARYNFRLAQLEFETAVNEDPKTTDRHFNLATASQRLKEYDRAIQEYDQAIKYYPGNGKAHSGKIDCLVEMQASQGEIDKAVATALDALDNSHHGGIYVRLALAYYRTGRTAQMPAVLAKAVRAAPGDSYVQAWAGRFYLRLGQRDLARQHLLIAYRLNPDEPDVAHDLGTLGESLPPIAGQ